MFDSLWDVLLKGFTFFSVNDMACFFTNHFFLNVVSTWKPQGPEVYAGCIWTACWTVISCRPDAKGCSHSKSTLWCRSFGGRSYLAVGWEGKWAQIITLFWIHNFIIPFEAFNFPIVVDTYCWKTAMYGFKILHFFLKIYLGAFKANPNRGFVFFSGF